MTNPCYSYIKSRAVVLSQKIGCQTVPAYSGYINPFVPWSRKYARKGRGRGWGIVREIPIVEI